MDFTDASKTGQDDAGSELSNRLLETAKFCYHGIPVVKCD